MEIIEDLDKVIVWYKWKQGWNGWIEEGAKEINIFIISGKGLSMGQSTKLIAEDVELRKIFVKSEMAEHF